MDNANNKSDSPGNEDLEAKEKNKGTNPQDSKPAISGNPSNNATGTRTDIKSKDPGGDEAESALSGFSAQSYAKLENAASNAISNAQETIATLENTAAELSNKVTAAAAQFESATVPGKPAANDQMRLGHIAYFLFALGPLTALSLLFGVFLCRLKLKSNIIAETILESHFRWLTRTFYLGFLVVAIALVLRWLFGDIVGLLAGLVALVWFAWRIVKGWLSLYDGQEIADPRALW